MWRVPDDFSVDAAVTANQQVVSKLASEMPTYHTRAEKGCHKSLWPLYA